MPTCRMCKWASPRWRCAIRHKYVLGSEIVQCHEPRETPLLVDELAKMVRLLMSPIGEAIAERAEAVDEARMLLERYEEEVGDA